MSPFDGVNGPGPLGRDPLSTLSALKSGNIRGEEARLRAATDLLESAFFQELFKAMRDTVPESGLLGGGSGEDAFSSMLDQHIADAAASRLTGGLGQALYRRFAGEGPKDSPEADDSMKMGEHIPASTGRSS